MVVGGVGEVDEAAEGRGGWAHQPLNCSLCNKLKAHLLPYHQLLAVAVGVVVVGGWVVLPKLLQRVRRSSQERIAPSTLRLHVLGEEVDAMGRVPTRKMGSRPLTIATKSAKRIRFSA